MIERIRFETIVEDIKTSKVKEDICPLKGELEYNGREVKFKIVASSVNKDVLEELFGDVGATVTFEWVFISFCRVIVPSVVFNSLRSLKTDVI